jgi:hypothetical protein
MRVELDGDLWKQPFRQHGSLPCLPGLSYHTPHSETLASPAFTKCVTSHRRGSSVLWKRQVSIHTLSRLPELCARDPPLTTFRNHLGRLVISYCSRIYVCGISSFYPCVPPQASANRTRHPPPARERPRLAVLVHVRMQI